jgi:hypothetical protein
MIYRTATPCPQGHAEGICPYGQSCIADTPCNEIRAQNEEQPGSSTTSTVLPGTTTTIVTTEMMISTLSNSPMTTEQATMMTTEPVQEVLPSQTTSTATTSASSSSSETTTQQPVEQIQPQDMDPMMSNTDPNAIHDYETSCTLHSDCHNQLCGLPNSGFEGICVDCLFSNHIGCRASQICVVSLSTGMPSCQEKPAVATTSTTTSTTSSSSTTIEQLEEDPSEIMILSQGLSMQTQYQNPSDNVYFCGRTYESITDSCLQSKPCPSGIAAIDCGHEEGCFAHSECQTEYEAVGATITGPEESMNAFAAFDTTWDDANRDGLEEGDETTSFWASTWRDSSSGPSRDVITWIGVFISGFLLLIS